MRVDSQIKNRHFEITGSVNDSGSPAALFQTDAVGDGTLTLSSGKRYRIVDWFVVT
jgi:hypothetical protein